MYSLFEAGNIVKENGFRLRAECSDWLGMDGFNPEQNLFGLLAS